MCFPICGMEAYPGKSGELVQYNHIIHTASQTFAWDNVYRYDREFRVHMSKHHPVRSWAVILQQAWSVYLKDKVGNQNSPSHNHQSQKGNGAQKKICFDFNRGECTFGQRCRFDHRCSFCNKYGHGSFNCRKARRGSRNNYSNSNFNNNNNGTGNVGKMSHPVIENIPNKSGK